jgi:hypothetical protein
VTEIDLELLVDFIPAVDYVNVSQEEQIAPERFRVEDGCRC